jgi:hypothetical protein
VLLNRGAFKIVDMYKLRDPETTKNHGLTTSPPTEEFLRKVASLALSGMDGETLLKGTPLTHHQGGWHRWWTKNGWRVSVMTHDTSLDWRIKNTSIGSKPHKSSKTYDPHDVRLEIETPFGQVRGHVFADSRVKETIQDMWSDYSRLKSARGDAHSPEWKPETEADYVAAEKRRDQVALWNKIRKEHRLKPIDQETVERMLKNGQGPLGWYYMPKANELRTRKGLPAWSRDDWERYRDGKTKLYDYAPGGPSAASKARLDAILKRRQEMMDPAGLKPGLPGDQDDSNITRRELFKMSPFNPHFGPRSLAAINALRAKSSLSPMTPAQYAKYQQDPDHWQLDRWDPEPRIYHRRPG